MQHHASCAQHRRSADAAAPDSGLLLSAAAALCALAVRDSFIRHDLLVCVPAGIAQQTGRRQQAAGQRSSDGCHRVTVGCMP